MSGRGVTVISTVLLLVTNAITLGRTPVLAGTMQLKAGYEIVVT